VPKAAAFWSARGGVRRCIALMTGSILALAVVILAGRLPASAQTEKQFEQYQQAGRYPEAERLGRQAVEVCEKRFGRDKVQCAWTLNSLAIVYKAQGKYAEAERLHKRALAIYEQALGASHPDVAVTLVGMGIVYQAQRRYAEAEALYKRALAIYEQALGANHPAVALTLNNLAILFGTAGDSRQALAFSRKASAAVIAHGLADAGSAGQRQRSGGLVEQRADYFVRHLANLAVAARQNIEPVPAAGREAIAIAQWHMSFTRRCWGPWRRSSRTNVTSSWCQRAS
jgi:tetratricopeptide (TPR) repeat protein